MKFCLRKSPHQLQQVLWIELIRKDGLDIRRRRSIGALCLLAAQQSAIAAAAGADKPRESFSFVHSFEMQALLQEAQVDGAAEFSGFPVLDVQGGRHLITVF